MLVMIFFLLYILVYTPLSKQGESKIMKTIIHLLACSLLVFGSANVLALDELPLGTGEWPPHTSEKMEGYGIVTEIVTAIVREMGMEPKYTFYPWMRAEDMALQGTVFGVFPYVRTADRAKRFDFSDNFFPGGDFKIFYNTKMFKKKPSWESIEDLKPFSVGAVKGFWYLKGLKEAGVHTELVQSDEQSFKMLHSQRIDILLAEENIGWWYVKKLFPDEISTFDVFDKSYANKKSPAGLMISRNYPDAEQLSQRFNQALQRIIKNGVYQSIVAKIKNPNHTPMD